MTVSAAFIRHDATAALLRRARWTWFVRGVRRSDRARMGADLQAELLAAADPADVVGGDVAELAGEWADAQRVSDRRLRLVLLLPATLAPGLIASGAVTATLYQAFTANGSTLLNRVSGASRLLTYVGTGLVTFLAMLVGAGVALSSVRDATRRATVRAFAAALCVGTILAIASGVGVAAARNYDSSRASVQLVIAAVVTSLAVPLSVSRWLVVRRRDRTP